MKPEITQSLARRSFLGSILLGLPALLVFRPEPPKKTVVLNRIRVAGFQYHQGMEDRRRIKVGDELEVVAEPENPHDRYAVALLWHGKHIGYVPRDENRHLSRMLRAHVPLLATVTKSDPDAETWDAVRVDVAMIQG
jgi:hypothetical protein